MKRVSAQILSELRSLGNPEIAAHSLRFFKTGPGEYGEGDRFLGIRVPVLRQVAKRYRTIAVADAVALLHSPLHEARLVALLILVMQYRAAESRAGQQAIYRAYLGEADHINNWDLVDLSAEHVVGAHLWERDRRPLYRLVRSSDLWRRRIAVVATFHFIRRNDLADTLALAERLLDDHEDLIHKATGWMLREVAKRDAGLVKTFLRRNAGRTPRTMLRYAIERFPETERRAFLRL